MEGAGQPAGLACVGPLPRGRGGRPLHARIKPPPGKPSSDPPQLHNSLGPRAHRASSQKLPSPTQYLTRRRLGGRAGPKEPSLHVLAKSLLVPRSSPPGVDRSAGKGAGRADGTLPSATLVPGRGV